jgi:hypothetical protein
MRQRPRFRLPKKYNRPISAKTRALVLRRHQRRSVGRRERTERRIRRIQRWILDCVAALRWWLVSLLVGLIVVAVLFLMFSSLFHVRAIRIQRSERRLDIERVEHALMPVMGRHILSVSSQEILDLLQKEIPDIADIALSKRYPSTLAIRTTLEPLIARVAIAPPDGREGSPPQGSGSTLHAYLTDSRRYVVSPVAESGDEQLPLLIVTDWPAIPTPGTELFPETLLTTMNKAEQTLLSEFGQKVVTRTIFLRAREFHFAMGKWSVWMDIASPLEGQIARYRVFLKEVGLPGVKEYIDLRVAGRVVYK